MKKQFNTQINFCGSLHEKSGKAHYKMSKTAYDFILKKRHGEFEKKMDPNSFVCMYVNQTFGLKQKIERVIVLED